MARLQRLTFAILLDVAAINWLVSPSLVVALRSSRHDSQRSYNDRSSWTSRYEDNSSPGQQREVSSLQFPGFKNAPWPKCTDALYNATRPCGFSLKYFRGFKHAEGTDLCLYFSENAKRAFDSMKFCAKFDGGKHTYAFCPGDAKKHEAALNTMPYNGYGYYMGYFFSKKEGKWVCVHDRKDPKAAKQWIRGAPSNKSKHDCSYMKSPGGKWKDDRCSGKWLKGFICEHHLERTETQKARVDVPQNVELGETLAISCFVKSEDEESSDGLFLMWRQQNRETKYQLNQTTNTPEDVLRKRKWHSAPIGKWPYLQFEKYNESVKYTYKTIPACERNLQHVYYFQNIWWNLHHAKWQCCFHSQQQCSEPFSIGIKVYPQKPTLTIAWEGAPGKFYEGKEFLEATCTAYVGGIEPSGLTWVYVSQGKTYTWVSQPGVRTKNLEPWVKIVKTPEQTQCPRPTDLWDFNTGTCYRAKFSRYTQSQAAGRCEEIQSDQGYPWMLAKITPELYEKMLGSHFRLRRTNYWIRLNDKKTEGSPQRQNGAKTSSDSWKERWHDLGSGKTGEDCAFLNTSGIYVNSRCNFRISYICQSPQRYTLSRLDYIAKTGPEYTSTLKIKMTHSAQLGCYSYRGNDRDLWDEVWRKNIKVFTSTNIKYLAMPGEPQLDVIWPGETPGEIYSGEHFTASCEAFLGGEHPAIRWNILSPITGGYSLNHGPDSPEGFDFGWMEKLKAGPESQFDPDSGQFFTSRLKMRARKEMNRGRVDCYSYYGDDVKIHADASSRGVTLRKRSEKISFHYGVQKPVVRTKYLWGGGKTWLEMTCSTHVGDTHVMTWAVRLADRSIHTWKIFTDGRVESENQLEDIGVTFEDASISEEEGNNIAAMIRVNLSWNVHMSGVRCFPYDFSTGKPEHLKSRHPTSDLKVGKRIRMRNSGHSLRVEKIVAAEYRHAAAPSPGFETALGQWLSMMLAVPALAWCAAIIAIKTMAPEDSIDDLTDEMSANQADDDTGSRKDEPQISSESADTFNFQS